MENKTEIRMDNMKVKKVTVEFENGMTKVCNIFVAVVKMNETEDEIALGVMGNCSENFIGRSAYHLIEMLADGKEGTGNIGMEFARLGMQFGHDRVMKEVLEYVMRREG